MDLYFPQTRVRRPIIYFNRTRDLNDICITVTVYQYYGNYSISQPVTGLPTARIYGHISIEMIIIIMIFINVTCYSEKKISQE